MKKKDVNYKLIMGMHAVGNQCKDCANAFRDMDNELGCKLLHLLVNPKATCAKFTDKPD